MVTAVFTEGDDAFSYNLHILVWDAKTYVLRILLNPALAFGCVRCVSIFKLQISRQQAN